MRFKSKSTAAAVVACCLLLVALAAYAKRPDGGSTSGNAAPTVSISAPTTGARFASGSVIRVAADASDSDGNLSRVDFYADGELLGGDSRAPFAIDWNGAGVGTHLLTAIATDKRKASTTSATVAISVAAVPDTIAPGVPGGLSATGQTDTSVSLRWDASNDNAGGSGIAGYELYRDGVLVASPSGTSFTDAGLAAASSYAYAVRSRDIAGNVSGLSAQFVASTTTGDSGDARRVVGYFTQWGIYTQNYLVRNLDANGSAARLSHLTYAFGNVRNNRCEVGVLKATNPATGEGGDAYADYSRSFSAAESVDGVADVWGTPLRGNWNQLRKLKARHPGLKVLISLGGWNWSRGFASASRPENREAFVASCIDAYIHGNLPAFDAAGGPGAAAGVFDGFDIDWEYPAACGLSCGSSADSDNFTALLAEFRRQLDLVRPGLELSVAVGGGIDKIRVTRPDLYQAYVDHINVMTYDFHGTWEASTNFHSALFDSPNDPATGDARYYNSNDAIQALLDRGVPAAKLNLGMASYGRGWTNVGGANHGLYQAGVPANGSLEPGIERYRTLKALGYPLYADPDTKARWIFNGNTFWSYDDPVTISDKMTYVRVQGLGGAFLWDFSGDDDQGALLAAIANGLQ